MCVVMDYAEKQGEKKGEKKGLEQGYDNLWQAVQNRVITLQQAAGICKMSVEEFQEKLKEYQII